MINLLGEDYGRERYQEHLSEAEDERLARSASASKPRTGIGPFLTALLSSRYVSQQWCAECANSW